MIRVNAITPTGAMAVSVAAFRSSKDLLKAEGDRLIDDLIGFLDGELGTVRNSTERINRVDACIHAVNGFSAPKEGTVPRAYFEARKVADRIVGITPKEKRCGV